MNLIWTVTSSNETSFTVERKTGAGGTYSQIGSASANATSYGDTSATAGNVYYYRVRSANGAGNSAYTSEASIDFSIPTAPSGLGASGTSSSQINLTWADNSGNEANIKLERKTGSGGTYAQIASLGANATSYNDTGLNPAQTYYYRVRATSNVGTPRTRTRRAAPPRPPRTSPTAPSATPTTPSATSSRPARHRHALLGEDVGGVAPAATAGGV